MSVLKSTLKLTLLDKASGPARALSKNIARTQRQLSEMRGKMLGATGAGYALFRGLSAPIKAATNFESAMADVAKVVDFKSPAGLKQMAADIRALSLEMPITAAGIADIVQAAGQSGIANSELIEFAKIAAKVGVAWDMTAGDTGQALAKLKTALGFSVADTARLADVINHLGNKSAASAPQILEVTKRVAPMASTFGLTADVVAALGAAMTGAGFESEVAATSILNVGRALTKGSSATARQSKAMTRLGLDTKQVAKSMQKDGIGTIQDVLARIRKLPAELRASTISDIFGDEARALGPLISNGQLLADTLALIAKQSNYAGSSSEEFSKQSKTNAFLMGVFRNRVNDLGISVGNALLPSLNKFLGVVGPMISKVSALAQKFPEVTNMIVGTTAALIAAKVAAIGFGFAGLMAKSGILRIASATLSLLNPFKLATRAINLFKLALVSTGVGAILVGIGSAAAFIVTNFEGLKTAALAFSDTFLKAIEPIAPMFEPIKPAFEWLKNAISGLMTPLDASGKKWAEWGASAGKAAADVVLWIADIPHKFRLMRGAMIEGGKILGQAIFDGIKNIINEIAAYIKTQLSNAISSVSGAARNLASKLSFGLISPKSPNVDGARANGGPVSAGKTYLVGERGPEFFQPGASGMISPNQAYRAAASGRVSNGRTTANVNVAFNPTFNISHGVDADSIANDLLTGLGAATKEAVESSYSD